MHDICCSHGMALTSVADELFTGNSGVFGNMYDINMPFYRYPPEIGYYQCYLLAEIFTSCRHHMIQNPIVIVGTHITIQLNHR